MYFIFCIRQNQNILIKLSIFSSLETENEAETSIYIFKNEQIEICSTKIHLFLEFLSANAPLFLGYHQLHSHQNIENIFASYYINLYK